jgi:hypothetical protein
VAVGFALSSIPDPKMNRYVQPFLMGFNPPQTGQATLNVFDTNGKAGFDLTTTTPTTTTNVRESF